MFGISGYTPLKGFDGIYIYMMGISWEYLTNTNTSSTAQGGGGSFRIGNL